MRLPKMPKQPSHKLTFEDAVEIWRLFALGHFPQRISAKFDCNIARIYEVLKEEKFVGSKGVAAKSFEEENSALCNWLREFKFKSKKDGDDGQADLFGPRPSS